MRDHRVGRHAGHATAILLVVVALLATGCGGKKDNSRSSDPNEVGDAATQSVACRSGFDVENPDGDEAPVTPEVGGTISYGVEAETDGWNASTNRWALSGNLIAGSFYDTLTKPTADGGFAPYLAQSVEHDDDYTTWTITLREGVTFHDGTPLTADAVKLNLDAFTNSVLTGASLSNIDTVEVTGEFTVDVNMKNPWVPFPQYLASQVGVVMAPAMFDDPESNLHPIGTGPFEFDSWTPDNKLTVVRYDDYWQTDADGNHLPYLDGIEFIPLPDPTQRKQSLDAGDVQVLHTFTADQITDFRERADEGQLNEYESCAWGEDEEFLLMFNNAKPPFDDKLAREAVARAIDREAVMETLFGDTFESATGPWASGSPWYSEPPADQVEGIYDPVRARELAVEYEEKHGEPISFTLGAPSSIQEALTSQQLTEQYLDEVGIEVELETSEFATYVVDAVTGDFQANIWRQFGASDPDGEYVWWHPDNVKPLGELSLNMARFNDEELGAALDQGRENADPAVRKEAYAEVQRIFREEFYLGWTAHAFWSVATQPEVQDVVNWTTQEGVQGLPLSGGIHPFAQIWLKSN